MITAAIIFIFTYLIITGRKLRIIKIGRPAGVMLGSVLMVCAGIIKPENAYNLVNWDTIFLLLGMMIIIEHLADANFFQIVANWIDKKQLSSTKLLAVIVLGLGFLAAFFVNDIVCIFFTPILVLMLKKRKLPPLPFIIGLATATNIGGIIAYTGTPQNMIIGSISQIPFARYFLLMLPIGIICLALNYFLLTVFYRNELKKTIENSLCEQNPQKKAGFSRSTTIIILVIISFFFVNNIAWAAITGAAILLLISARDEKTVLNRIDWNLLIFFAGLFIVVGGLNESGLVDKFIVKTSPYLNGNISSMWILGGCTIIGSNLFANVPFVLVISEAIKNSTNAESLWFVLAFSSTIAGNLTLIGAVANVIVVERAKEVYDVTFADFLKFGIISTLFCFIIGMLILSIYSALGIF